MNKEIELENKKEDKKHLIKFVLVMLGCLVLGFISGFTMSFFEDINVTQFISESAVEIIMTVSIYGPIVLAVVGFVVFVIAFGKAKKLYSTWDGEDDEVYRRIEGLLNIALSPTIVAQILVLVFLAIGLVKLDMLINEEMVITLVVFGVGIVLSCVFMIIGQVKVVNFEKVLNPEKKGSALDLKFQEKWISSFDEAELSITYRATFVSYKTVNTTCGILWFVCFIGMMTFNLGIAPMCIIGVIWLVSQMSYVIACMKFENQKK